MPTKKEPLVYSTQDIKRILGIGNSTIHGLLSREDGPIPHFRIGRRIVIPCNLFQQWLDNQTENYMGKEDCDGN